MQKTILFNVVERPFDMRSLGIYRIAHVLRENNWDVEVIDYSNFWTLDQLKQLFNSRNSADLKFIGFSQLFSHWPAIMEEFCAWVKEHHPHLAIISGSPSFPNFDSDYIDYYVRGFGEHAVIELLKYITGNGPRPRFDISSSNGKKIIDAITAYPAFPMADLFVRYEDRDFIEPEESLPIETSRGCKFSCAFCSFPVLGVKGDYTRSAADFELQLKDNYDRFGVKTYIAADETFNDSTEKISKFADVVERLDFSPWFSGYLRPDLLISRPRDREELLRMNFLGHWFGVETFNHESAKAIGKGMASEKLKHGVLDLLKYFTTHGSQRYRAGLSFIVGLPHETKESLEQTYQWLVDNWQGQHFIAYALAIQNPDLKESLSKISKNYQSYGYEIITDEMDSKLNFTEQKKYFKDIVNWKNPHMTFGEASAISDKWHNLKTELNFGIGVFNLHERYNPNYTIDQLLNFSLKDTNNRRTLQTNPVHIQKYINNKLNLV